MIWFLSALLSLLADNLILTRALGTSTLMAAARSRSNLLLLSVLITVFSEAGCVLSGTVCRLLKSAGMTADKMLLPLIYTFTVSVIYIVILLLIFRFSRKYFYRIKKYVHLSAFNCAVTGTLYLNWEKESGSSPLFGLQAGLGFLLASLMLTAVQKRLYSEKVPAAFRGMPAVMTYIGLLSMAVYALTIV